MNRSLTRWAGASTLALASSVVCFTAVVSQAAPAAIDAGNSKDTHALALRACAAQYAENGDMQECLMKVFAAAARDETLDDLQNDIEQVAARSARVTNACHSAAHEAGTTLVTSKDTILDQLTKADYPGWVADGCLFGISHGITDMMIIEPELMPEWPDIIAACEAARGDAPGNSYAGCVDGLGHLAWNDTGDEYKAAEHCTGFRKPQDVEFCVYSLMMGQFRPLPELEVHPVPPDRSPEEWANGCVAMEDLGEAAVRGCAGGAGYVHVHTGEGRERSDEIEAAATVDLDKAIALGIEVVDDTVGWCAGLDKAVENGKSICTVGALSTLPQAVLEPARVWEEVCSRKDLALSSCRERTS